MLTKQELAHLIENVLQPDALDDMTFDQCMQKFRVHFQKADSFRVSATLCYLIETQVSKTTPKSGHLSSIALRT